ncbi:hypothetical protein [Streptomyces sp. NPDC059080]|uniref:hypothetical protein n=1 Tax=Streptomyces sp. NPDC059080 TaxID=3346718 RepID=UPI0036C593E9
MVKRCDGFSPLGRQCGDDATWKVKRRDLVFSWFYTCGLHLDEICQEQEEKTGQTVEVIRLTA